MSDGEQKHDHWGLVYAGGLFVGIQQDLAIRNATNNKKSLDDVMRRLFKKYGGTENGYSLDELKTILTELNASDQTDIFDSYITGNKPLPITEIFEPAGFNARIKNGDLVISKNSETTALQATIQKGFFGEQ